MPSPGQIGPFALQNYEEAVGWAEMIEEVVRDGRMPPWHPDPKYGHFANDMSLTEDEKELIYKWVAAGAPEGDPKDLPEPKQYAGGWMMPGGPDEVFYMAEEPVDVPAEGTVDYRYYVVEPASPKTNGSSGRVHARQSGRRASHDRVHEAAQRRACSAAIVMAKKPAARPSRARRRNQDGRQQRRAQ